MRALLAEADGSIRSQLHAALTQRGWRVTVAQTAAEATERFRASPVPLVVLGRRFPDADALEVARLIRGSTLGQAAYLLVTIPVVVPEAVRPLVEAGVDDFLTLPLLPAQVEMRLGFAEYRLAVHPADPQGEDPVVSYPERLAEVERALRVEQASLEELFQSTPEGIVVVDDQDRVVRINEEFTRMFGYAPEEAVGKRIAELILPLECHDEAELVTRTAVGGRRITVETQRRHRDGRLIDVSLLATPIRVDDGSIGAYGIYRDISERKASERALRESESRYRALFDQSPVGVFLCDTALRITHCNQRLTQIVGLPYERIVGAPLRGAGRGLLPALKRVVVHQPASYDGPCHPPGAQAPVTVSVRYAPLRDSDGSVIGGMGVVEDVSDRVRAERELRAQAAELERVNAALRERTLELEAAMQARSRLYTSMNHELRTPISAIMLYQELLLAGALGELAPEQAQAMERSHGATRHLLDLVCDMLDLSRLEADKVTLHQADVCLRTVLQELLDTVHPLAQQHGSELRLDGADGMPMLRTDAQRLRQILLNLVSNAAKFGCGRPIVIRCRSEADGERITIEVVDQGVGIDAADLERIFEDFVQVGLPREGGTGLGLAISRRLAGLLGGRLEVESQPGVGSTFRLVLPVQLPAALAAAIPDPAK